MGNLGKILAYTLLSTLAIVGIYAGIGVKKLMSVCYNIVRYDFKFDIQTLTMSMILQVKNPSYLGIDLYGYDLDVFLNNKKVAVLAAKKHIHLATGQFTQVNIPVKVKYTDAFGSVGSKELFNSFMLGQFDKIFVTLKGNFYGEILKVNANVPVDYKINLKQIADIMDSPSDPCV